MLVQAIYLPQSTIFFFLKCLMVICPCSVHITMANVSPIFWHENSSLKCSGGSFHVKEDILC